MVVRDLGGDPDRGSDRLAVNGLNQGIDFTGGSQFDFPTTKPLSTGQMNSIVSPITGPDAVIRGVVGTRQAQGNAYTHFQIQSHYLTQAEQTPIYLRSRSGPCRLFHPKAYTHSRCWSCWL